MHIHQRSALYCPVTVSLCLIQAPGAANEDVIVSGGLGEVSSVYRNPFSHHSHNFNVCRTEQTQYSEDDPGLPSQEILFSKRQTGLGGQL